MKHSRFIHPSSLLANIANPYTTWDFSWMFSGEIYEINYLLLVVLFRSEINKWNLAHTRQCLFTMLRESSEFSLELIVFTYM